MGGGESSKSRFSFTFVASQRNQTEQTTRRLLLGDKAREVSVSYFTPAVVCHLKHTTMSNKKSSPTNSRGKRKAQCLLVVLPPSTQILSLSLSPRVYWSHSKGCSTHAGDFTPLTGSLARFRISAGAGQWDRRVHQEDLIDGLNNVRMRTQILKKTL